MGREVYAAALNATVPALFVASAHVLMSSGIGFFDVLWYDAMWSCPLAALVAWRTLVHGRRFRRDCVVKWFQPLLEAATCGTLTAAWFLHRPLLTDPSNPMLYLILAIGAAIGMSLGLVMEWTALLILKQRTNAA